MVKFDPSYVILVVAGLEEVFLSVNYKTENI